MMINMTLRQFRYFDSLARHGHFGRAAEACAISQPALSMQIKELEEALGGLLFERSARQVALSALGAELVQRVRDILRSVDELADFARASRDQLAGRLRVGMIPTIAPYLLPKVIENLARIHPQLDIHVRETQGAPSTGKWNTFLAASNTFGGGGFPLLSVALIEVVLTALFLVVITCVTSEKAAAGFAPIAIGLTLVTIHLMAIPVSNASVNPARSTATAICRRRGVALPLAVLGRADRRRHHRRPDR
jgi:hypothetical protein